MSRWLRNTSITVGATVAVVAATVVIVRIAQKSDLFKRLGASTPERQATAAELQLMELIGEAGWDIPADARVGTDRQGPFVELRTDFGFTELRFSADGTTFQVDVCDGEHLMSTDTIGITYDDFRTFIQPK